MIERGGFGASIEPEKFEYISIAQDAIHRHAKALSRVVPVTGVTLCYYLSNCIQALFGTAGFELKRTTIELNALK